VIEISSECKGRSIHHIVYYTIEWINYIIHTSQFWFSDLFIGLSLKLISLMN